MPGGLASQSLNGTAKDLVVIALPGVQRFISEARSTADVRAASEIIDVGKSCPVPRAWKFECPAGLVDVPDEGRVTREPRACGAFWADKWGPSLACRRGLAAGQGKHGPVRGRPGGMASG